MSDFQAFLKELRVSAVCLVCGGRCWDNAAVACAGEAKRRSRPFLLVGEAVLRKLTDEERKVLCIMSRYPTGADGLLEDDEQQREFNEEREHFDAIQMERGGRFSFDDYAVWAEISGLIDERWDLTDAGHESLRR